MLKIRQLLRCKVYNLLEIHNPVVNNAANQLFLKCASSSGTNVHLPNVKQLTEREHVVRARLNPDVFGSEHIEEAIEYEEDKKEDEYLSNPPDPRKKLTTKQYADIIKSFIKKRKIKEAIDVIEVRMLKEDKVKPENYLYNLVIGACGQVGYTKKAFSLYNQMKKRDLVITGGTYTALFNACANSPWTEDGLTRVKNLHNLIIEKRIDLNDTNYNALIKAYGRCGEINLAFGVVDEMIEKGFRIKDDTLNFLLQSCITDKEAGFRHALLVWRKLIDKKIPPTIYTYNLFLRSIRDCSLGDIETTKDVIQRILPKNDKFLQLEGNDQILIESGENQVAVENRPNLMSTVPHMGDIISLSEIKKPEDRLLLVGGMNKFIESMIVNKCTPNIKTFTQLLDCIPSTYSAEKELLSIMKKMDVEIDLDFYNMLLKKRAMRFDYNGAKIVVEEIKLAGHRPNLITYGILALSCKTKDEANLLLEEMKEHGYRLNTEILGAMLQQACYHNNFPYIFKIMELCREEDVPPNKKFMEHLDQFRNRCKTELVKEKPAPWAKSKSFHKFFTIFKLRYKTWRDEVKLEEKPHPWEQFEQTNETNSNNYKGKVANFKPRHLSKFKQKTGTLPMHQKTVGKVERKYFKKKKNMKRKTETYEE